jgi:NADH-quinone oxidoreductase subunit F
MGALMRREPVLSLTEPVDSLADYLAIGGGDGLAAARGRGTDDVIAEIRSAGLRDRGGVGFPTAAKWEALRASGATIRYLVCDATEDEPGTFKDRFVLRRNPYQVIEGILIAAAALQVSGVFVTIKETYRTEIAAFRRAVRQMGAHGMLGDVDVRLVLGPDEYLFGEEKTTAQAGAGVAPLARILPPCQASPVARGPTVTHNVETFANLPGILRRGADWFRSAGTDSSPGSMVFTVCGDVRLPGVYELPLGLPLSVLLDLVCAGAANGGRVKAVFSGVSAAPLPASKFDTALDFEEMRAAGSGLGSGGFVAYDDSACMVAATLLYARFLAIESCARSPACKHGSQQIAETLDRIESGSGESADIQTLRRKCGKVTGGEHAMVPTGLAAVVGGALDAFAAEFDAHLGRRCPSPRALRLPKLVDFDERTNRFQYDDRNQFRQSD